MDSIKRALSNLTVSGLFALAIGSLVFPPQLFAQPARPLDLGGPVPSAHIRIDVLEMAAGDELPARFRVDDGTGKRVIFEHRGGGYTWRAEGQPELNGYQAVPSLARALSWKAGQTDDGVLSARIPIADLRFEDPEALPFGPKLDFERASGPAVEVLGVFDDLERSVELSLLTPDQQVLDMTISFAGLAQKVQVGDSLDLPTGKVVIAIPWAVVLAILGVAVLGCIGLHAVCFVACALTCPNGVQSVASAVCGIGCTCVCK